MSASQPNTDPDHVDVLIVGAGISGIGAAYHLQDKQPQKSYAIIEAREDLWRELMHERLHQAVAPPPRSVDDVPTEIEGIPFAEPRGQVWPVCCSVLSSRTRAPSRSAERRWSSNAAALRRG